MERNLPIVNEIDIEGERRCVLRQSGKEGDTPHACRHSDPRRHRRSASRRHDDNIRAAPVCHVAHRLHATVCTCFDICVISHIVHIGKTLCAAVEEKNARPRRPCQLRVQDADRSRTDDGDGIPRSDAECLLSVHYTGKRLRERCTEIIHVVGNVLHIPELYGTRRNPHVFGKGTVHAEADRLTSPAEMRMPRATVRTRPTANGWSGDNACAHQLRRRIRPHLRHNARKFMPENHRRMDLRMSMSECAQIAAADRAHAHTHEKFPRPDSRLGALLHTHIPNAMIDRRFHGCTTS